MKKLIHAITKPIHAHVTIPGSKSITNRALLLAALADGVSEIFNLLISDDTRAFIGALRELGIVIQLDELTQSCIVAGCGGHLPKKEASVWCDDAGTALRFLVAACASSPGKYYFNGSDQLRARPIVPLLKVLTSAGAELDPAHATRLPFTILGTEGLQGGVMEVESMQSGQFVSALLMSAPFAKSPMTLKMDDVVSRPYIEMTCDMMAEFGVQVHRMHQERFSVPVPQRYRAHDYTVEPDLSTASYFFAAAAITDGEVTIQALDRENSKQADVAFLNVLEKMGCKIISTVDGLTVKGTDELRGVSVDMRHFSDTFMTLAAIAPFAKTPTSITNIAHARLKESDRIHAMRMGLEKLQVKVEEGPDWLRIYPSQPRGAIINSFNDHRIAMSFAVMGLRVPHIEIENAECVSKTCPEFFDMWENLREGLTV